MLFIRMAEGRKMTEPDKSLTVDIRPGVKTWFAVVEFIDSAILSCLVALQTSGAS